MKELWLLVKFISIINAVGWINSSDGSDNCTQPLIELWACKISMECGNIIIEDSIKLLIKNPI